MKIDNCEAIVNSQNILTPTDRKIYIMSIKITRHI